MEHSSRNYYKLGHLSKDSETLNKQAKPKLVESKMFALTARQLADSYKKKQIDTILKSVDELMK